VRTFVLLTICVSVVGCSGKPQFSNREELSDLEPYAQEYVHQILDNHFGEPTEMIVWDRLPLNVHLGQGRVAETGKRNVTFEVNEPHHAIVPGTEILWTSGDNVGQESGWIREWSEDDHAAVLDVELTNAPAEKDAVIFGPGQVLANGRMLYAEHCQHCHGTAGDGQGPTAPYLNPRPRDYRLGIFKFTTTNSESRAHRDDLARVIENGVAGTYMPSFKLLTDDESAAIVEYVMWLSMRGNVEESLVKTLADGYSREAVRDRVKKASEKRKADEEDGITDGEYETRKSIKQEFIDMVNGPDEIPYEFESIVERIATGWETSQTEEAMVRPKDSYPGSSAESISRGRQLYLSPDLNCVSCHGEAGYGDGAQTYTITKSMITKEDNELPGLYDNWGNPVKPRNLHSGIFRGGRRPIDLYSRVDAGIKGTPMPPFGAKLSDQQVWDLVNYIYSVPFEAEFAGAGKLEDVNLSEHPGAPKEATTPETPAAAPVN